MNKKKDYTILYISFGILIMFGLVVMYLFS